VDNESMNTAEFLELVSTFPLLPIVDGQTYQAALEILDRLFARDECQTPAELDYFRDLASLAFEFEQDSNINNSYYCEFPNTSASKCSQNC
jgi:hypothetical protein